MRIVIQPVDNGPSAPPQWVATTEPATAVHAVLGYTPVEVVTGIVERLLAAGYTLTAGAR